MKKIALLINYSAFIALFLSLLAESSILLQSIKYVLLIIAAYMLFRITNVYGGKSLFHGFNYSFVGIVFIFVIYALIGKSLLYTNLVIQLLVASIIGLGLSFMYQQPVRRVRKTEIMAPARPKARKVKKTTKQASKKTTTRKTSKKAATKRSTKKTSSKKSVAKRSTKTTGKRRGPGRPPKKKSSQKTSKKTSKKAPKKSVSKKSSNKIK
ncbi:MAG: hypothetical protein ACLFTH_04565 [Candidatus Woesearchaeota archaeon]